MQVRQGLAVEIPTSIMFLVFRVGVLDLTAVALVLIALLIPAREFLVESPFEATTTPSDLRIVARSQSVLLEEPGNGLAASTLAETLRRMDQHQAALRVAGDAYKRGGGWRAALAVSSIHADRVEVAPSFEYATLALEKCDESPATCPPHERLRMSLYHKGLRLGLESGVDPRQEPERFREEVLKAFRTSYRRK